MCANHPGNQPKRGRLDMKHFALIAAATLAAAPALAESHASGDPAKGEAVFKKCVSCHVVQNGAGEVLAGRNAKTGPNLYGVAGRHAGSVEGFRYGDSLKAAGEAGLVWDEEHFVAYVLDPKKFLADYLNDPKARSKMSFKLRSEDEAKDVYAYLAQFHD